MFVEILRELSAEHYWNFNTSYISSQRNQLVRNVLTITLGIIICHCCTKYYEPDLRIFCQRTAYPQLRMMYLYRLPRYNIYRYIQLLSSLCADRKTNTFVSRKKRSIVNEEPHTVYKLAVITNAIITL